MEEILSSIKRIIADDGEARASLSARQDGADREAERESRRKAVVADMAKDAESMTVASYVDEVLELTDEMPRIGQAEKAAMSEPEAVKAGLGEAPASDKTPKAEQQAAAKSAAQPEAAPAVAPAVADELSAPDAANGASASGQAGESLASIVSAESEAAARSSLASLSSLLVKPEAGENTLEGLVREMLRPMLKQWLDANLPPLVESMVAKEIARITGRAL